MRCDGGRPLGPVVQLLTRGAAALGLTALVATCAVLSALSALSVSGARASAPDLDDAVSAMAATTVAVVLAVWSCGAAVTAAAITVRAAGRASTALDALARATTPAVLRRVVAVALGAGVMGVAAGPALAAPSGSDLTWPAASTSAAPSSSAGSSREEVVVRPGDTLWGIAAAELPAGAPAREVAGAWPLWYAANRAVIGDDPGLLQPGQHLDVPPSTPSAAPTTEGSQR